MEIKHDDTPHESPIESEPKENKAKRFGSKSSLSTSSRLALDTTKLPDRLPPNTLWIYPPENSEWRDAIAKEFGVPSVIAQTLVSRGYASNKAIHQFLYARLPDLHPPSLFSQIDIAVTKILSLIDQGEKILIFGDNDVDGISGTALLVEYFTLIKASIEFFLPTRSAHSNTLPSIMQAAEWGKEQGCKLMITVDCGIGSKKEIDQIEKSGLEVIVTDHHEPTGRVPACSAVLNPKLLTNSYPFSDLTGVGVAFKLVHAITERLIEQDDPRATSIDLKHFLDLVALGTIADMAPLLQENRILVRYGVEQLKKNPRPGLKQLFNVSYVNIENLTPADIASKVAPRLNSLGRIADPRKGVELLLATDPEHASTLAEELNLNNIQRQKIDHELSEDVDQFLLEHPELLKNKAIILSSNKWHPGVVAIVTSRIAKLYNRPTILIAVENGIGKGSIRTIPEFPLMSTLKENSDILINYGGHDFAAGLTIEEKNIPILKDRFLKKTNAILRNQDIAPKLYLDAYAPFSDLSFEFMESLALLSPYGNENPQPIFTCQAKLMWTPKVIGKDQHLKLFLEQGDRTLEAIGFGMAKRKDELMHKKQPELLIAYTPQINNFQHKISIQLILRDFRIV